MRSMARVHKLCFSLMPADKIKLFTLPLTSSNIVKVIANTSNADTVYIIINFRLL